MELANIEKLLEKYLEATTSLQEEKALRDYFTSGNIAPHLEEYGMLFGYFKENQSETCTKIIKLKPEKTRKKNLKWLTIAASLTLLVSMYLGKQAYDEEKKREKQLKYYAQVKEALQMISSNLNKGNDALYAVSNNLNKGTEAVAKLDTYDKTVKTVLSKVNY